MDSNKRLAFELQNVISQFKRTIALNHNHSKLRGAEKRVLFLVYGLKNSQPMTTSEIAEKMGVTLAAVTRPMNAMEKQGLIKRLPDASDRRVSKLELTRKGEAQVVKLKEEFAQKTRVLVEFLGQKDTSDLIRLVKKLSGFKGFVKQ
jgi:DNA-binding MarR family transcriptional regulator